MCSLFRDMEGGDIDGGPRAFEIIAHPRKIHSNGVNSKLTSQKKHGNT